MNIIFIGWCNEGTSDKIWGFFEVGDTDPMDLKPDINSPWGYFGRGAEKKSFYSFWGARGKKISFKRDNGNDGWLAFTKLAESKQNKKEKSYKPVDEAKLLEIFPDFHDKLAEYFVSEKFSGAIRNDNLDDDGGSFI